MLEYNRCVWTLEKRIYTKYTEDFKRRIGETGKFFDPSRPDQWLDEARSLNQTLWRNISFYAKCLGYQDGVWPDNKHPKVVEMEGRLPKIPPRTPSYSTSLLLQLMREYEPCPLRIRRQ